MSTVAERTINLSFTIHPVQKTVYPLIAECFVEARGADYYSAEYYDAGWLESNIELFAAFNGTGELVGAAGLTQGLFNDEKTTGCLLTIRPGFTGYGIAKRLIKHFSDVLHRREARVVKGQVVTLHIGVQRIVESFGWIATGFLPGARHGKNALVLYTGKLSKDVLLKDSLLKDNAGKLYIHPDISGLAEPIYNSLGVKVDIQNTGQCGETCISRLHDTHNRTLYIHATECGAGFVRELHELQELHELHELQERSIVVLNLNDPSAIFGYEALRSAGYRFCGFDPLGQYEHAIFYNTVFNGDMQMTEQVKILKQEVDSI